MRALPIVLLCIVAAVCYGIIHDQITVRVCVEYFTLGHPPVFPTDNPTLLGLGWGVIATWWAGLLLGVPLAIAACVGNRPKQNVRLLVRPLAVLMLVTGACAANAGVIGWLASEAGWVFLIEPMASRVPTEKHSAFLADLWAHSASYAAGFVGGIVLAVRVWRSRRSIT